MVEGFDDNLWWNIELGCLTYANSQRNGWSALYFPSKTWLKIWSKIKAHHACFWMLYVCGCVRFGGFTAWLRVCMELVGYSASQVACQSVLSIYCICLYIIYMFNMFIYVYISYMFLYVYIYYICFTAWLRVCTELVGYLASQVAANRSIHRYLTNSPPTQYSLYDIICQIFQEVSAFLQIGNPSGLWLILSLIRKTYNIWSKQKRQIYLVVLVVNVLEHLQVSTDIRSNDVELMVKYIESKRPLS